MKASVLFESTKKVLTKNTPGILTGIGIAGMIASTVMAVHATPKAIMLMNEKEIELEVDKLSAKEVVQTTWKCYIPSVVTGAASIACIIGASSVNARRNAALLTAYTLSETALKEYKDKVIEEVGTKKAQEIRDSIAKDHLEKKPVETSEVLVTEKGETLCYDVISGRYFKSDIEKIRRSVNELNRQMLSEGCVSLNDLYYEIGLDSIGIGSDLGWNANRGLVDLHFSSQLASDGTPCLVLDFVEAPYYNYN